MMEGDAVPIYLNWQFWTALVALLALVLSQLPPVHLLFRPRRLAVEVYSRLQVTHKVGNPNLGMFLRIRNAGGRTLEVRSIEIGVSRDGVALGNFPAQTYFESPSSQASVLFVPFILKPGGDWSRMTNFFRPWDRATEKLYRASESALAAEIRKKLSEKEEGDKRAVAAEPALVKPFAELFEKLFVWLPGEYILTLSVNAEPGSATYTKQYRFTLYESDSVELRSHTDDYKFGGGLAYNVERHAGIFVPLIEHGG